ncbi:hypothetical protein DFH28DRAFT_929178 [Melampsora americana]|nr:hypothetical protein DFH28DRAFT_929178 [Melampsora americana]
MINIFNIFCTDDCAGRHDDLKTKKSTSYYLTPINPYCLIPNPSKNGETGLVCKSKACKSKPTHSNTYYKSQYKHLVGVKTQLMRGTDVLPTPPHTQPMLGENQAANAGECMGVHRTIASDHQTRKNAGCSVNACKAVTEELVHYLYHVSGGQKFIAQLDCDVHGRISNIVCYSHSKIQSIGGNMGQVIERAFCHIKQDHDCNHCIYCGVLNTITDCLKDNVKSLKSCVQNLVVLIAKK